MPDTATLPHVASCSLRPGSASSGAHAKKPPHPYVKICRTADPEAELAISWFLSDGADGTRTHDL